VLIKVLARDQGERYGLKKSSQCLNDIDQIHWGVSDLTPRQETGPLLFSSRLCSELGAEGRRGRHKISLSLFERGTNRLCQGRAVKLELVGEKPDIVKVFQTAIDFAVMDHGLILLSDHAFTTIALQHGRWKIEERR